MMLDLHSAGLVRLALGPIHWVPCAGGKKGFAVWYTAIQDRQVEIWIGLPALRLHREIIKAFNGKWTYAIAPNRQRHEAVIFRHALLIFIEMAQPPRPDVPIDRAQTVPQCYKTFLKISKCSDWPAARG